MRRIGHRCRSLIRLLCEHAAVVLGGYAAVPERQPLQILDETAQVYQPLDVKARL
jgi:hypothetical protein